MNLVRVAIPSPLRRCFDYLPSAEGMPAAGCRVEVPFGRRRLVGVVIGETADSAVPHARLKPVSRVLDREPLLPEVIMQLLRWATDYYHHPPGDVFSAALPVMLRQGKPARAEGLRRYRITEAGIAAAPNVAKRAPRQYALLQRLQAVGAAGLLESAFNESETPWRPTMARLEEKSWVERQTEPCLQAPPTAEPVVVPPPLNPAQQAAVDAVGAALGRFQPFLLDGVTGSGKTEVYLRVVEQVLAAGRQALILVPEIGLTPQLVERFRRRFPVPIAILHSGLADGERLCAWMMARDGQAPIVLGTRSAVFTPLARPGLIVIDEEHDPSLKQQEGFRYSARDVAVVRARLEGVPVLLGSATPALESIQNVVAGRYRRLHLPERAGGAAAPGLRLVDLRGQPVVEGLSPPLLGAMAAHLERGEQVLLFLNRRGYAPTLLCHECGWISQCPRCDAHLTLYGNDRRLRCHHCGSEQPVARQCPDCGSPELVPVGRGTERVEETLRARFDAYPVIRIDRDSTRRKGSMEQLLEQVHRGEPTILLGTQMLAKGHHFPAVTLVSILDADGGLFSADFRASERMAQLIVQVAGRAGRAERPGTVLIQTHHPEHPLLTRLVREDYAAFADAALNERRETQLPPFTYLALLRAEGLRPEEPEQFLSAAVALARRLGHAGVELWGPVPAPMERRAGRFRAQLLLQAPTRAELHRLLKPFAPALEALPEGRRVRWSLDVDPAEMF